MLLLSFFPLFLLCSKRSNGHVSTFFFSLVFCLLSNTFLFTAEKDRHQFSIPLSIPFPPPSAPPTLSTALRLISHPCCDIKYAHRSHLYRMAGGRGVRDAARGVRFLFLDLKKKSRANLKTKNLGEPKTPPTLSRSGTARILGSSAAYGVSRAKSTQNTAGECIGPARRSLGRELFEKRETFLENRF